MIKKIRIGLFKKVTAAFIIGLMAISLSGCTVPFINKIPFFNKSKQKQTSKVNTSKSANSTTPSAASANTNTNSNKTTNNANSGNNNTNSSQANNNQTNTGNTQINGLNNQNNSQNTDTLPNTILDAGQTWREAGSELTLNDASMVNGNFQGVIFSLTYKNNKGHDISFGYTINSNIKVNDNIKGSEPVIGYSNDVVYSPSGFETTKITQVVQNGTSTSLSSNYIYFLAKTDLGNSKITQLTVTVSGISNITKAQWRIPLYH